ncbi:MAG: hypothetical protein ACR2KG_11660 [Nocardioidaceae bacterium]
MFEQDVVGVDAVRDLLVMLSQGKAPNRTSSACWLGCVAGYDESTAAKSLGCTT